MFSVRSSPELTTAVDPLEPREVTDDPTSCVELDVPEPLAALQRRLVLSLDSDLADASSRPRSRSSGKIGIELLLP